MIYNIWNMVYCTYNIYIYLSLIYYLLNIKYYRLLYHILLYLLFDYIYIYNYCHSILYLWLYILYLYYILFIYIYILLLHHITYILIYTVSADPGLGQGRGGAWDHRRCGTGFCRFKPAVCLQSHLSLGHSRRLAKNSFIFAVHGLHPAHFLIAAASDIRIFASTHEAQQTWNIVSL